jgi:hypothetical protein
MYRYFALYVFRFIYNLNLKKTEIRDLNVELLVGPVGCCGECFLEPAGLPKM